MGKPEKALLAFNKEPLNIDRQTGLILYYHTAGRKKEADEALNNFISQYNQWPYRIASIYGYMGDVENALKWFDIAYIKQDSWLIFIKNDMLLKSLWKDHRFITFLKKMNLQ